MSKGSPTLSNLAWKEGEVDLLEDWIETGLLFFCFKSRKDLSMFPE